MEYQIHIQRAINATLLSEQVRAVSAAIETIAVEAGNGWAVLFYTTSADADDPIHAQIAAVIAAHDASAETDDQRIERQRIEGAATISSDVSMLLSGADEATTVRELAAVVRSAILLAGKLAFVGGLSDQSTE